LILGIKRPSIAFDKSIYFVEELMYNQQKLMLQILCFYNLQADDLKETKGLMLKT